MPGVFLSYARKDGEQLAALLRERLTREAPDIVIRQDRLILEGGVGWWKQITDAIDSVEFLILLMTPAAIASDNVQKEWRYARQQGVCVYPVKGAPDSEMRFAEMPRWMSKAHFYDLEKEWPTFLAHLRKGCHTPRVPFMAPDLPPHFVQRPSEFEALKNLLLSVDRGRSVAITTALAGAGGFGKTTLATALCHDGDIVQNFDDGILWVTLGQTPDLLRSLLTTYAALTGDRPAFASEEDAGFHLGQKLKERSCLLVIDDVWDATHLRPFLRGGKSSARLFTTRAVNIAAQAASVLVDEMRAPEAVALLTRGVPGLESGAARDLAERLGEWPLALELAAATMRERIQQGESAGRAADRLQTIIERNGVRALEDPTAEGRHRTISAVIEVSLELLDAADCRRLAELSIFPEDVPIPLAAAGAIWGLDDFHAEGLGQRLARLSLLKIDLQAAVLRLHDVMRAWLASRLGGACEIHSGLVDGWKDWWNLPDLPGEYAWRWLAWHLRKAGRRNELDRILWDPRWIRTKLKATDVSALIADYKHGKPSAELDLLQGALRLSSHVLATDSGQFASQLTGRLLPYRDSSRVNRFLGNLAAAAPARWLRPLGPALAPPGLALVRTLEGHSDRVLGVALSADGQRAVSASADHTLKVWDLATGSELRTLEGHSDRVYGVALSADGQRAVSASADHTLKVWDLATGSELRTLYGHLKGVRGVALSANGQRGVSASSDDTLKVWDLETGRELRTLEVKGVSRVALSADGQRAVSASADHTLKVWDLEQGREIHTLEGHSSSVCGIAMSADGQCAVSVSDDHTMKVWDLDSGIPLRTLKHLSYVMGVAVRADGRRAISVCYDHTLKVWDLKTGRELRTLDGYSEGGVAISADGRCAVSASSDHTLKVWDLETACELRAPEGHSAAVFSIAVSIDGQLAVSASLDRTLQVWDLETGRAQRTLEGLWSFTPGVAVSADGHHAVSHDKSGTLTVWDLETARAVRTLSGLLNVEISVDGRRAVSTSSDHTVKVWDLETGRGLRTLKGHTGFATSVAVSQDGRLAVSACYDEAIKVWDLETGRELHILEGHSSRVTAVSISPDGCRAVSAHSDHTLTLWDLETGHELRTLENHSGFANRVAVSGDGRHVVSASSDRTLKVWDLETGALLTTFNCDAPALCCAFYAVRKIVAGDRWGRVHFLSLELQEDI